VFFRPEGLLGEGTGGYSLQSPFLIRSWARRLLKNAEYWNSLFSCVL